MVFGIHFSMYMILAALGIMIVGRIVQWFLRMTAHLDHLDEKYVNKGRQISIFLIAVCLLVLAALPVPDMDGIITLIRQAAILAGWLSAILYCIMPLVLYMFGFSNQEKAGSK